jgi:DNA-binding NarL/FixJ family response regulator
MTIVKTFIVEDNAVIRDKLISALEEMAAIQVVGFAANEAEALNWLLPGPRRCDLVIIDIFLRQGSGLGVLRALADSGLPVHRVVLTNYATADMRRRCSELGAHRVFDKSHELDGLIDYCGQLADGTATAAGALA